MYVYYLFSSNKAFVALVKGRAVRASGLVASRRPVFAGSSRSDPSACNIAVRLSV